MCITMHRSVIDTFSTLDKIIELDDYKLIISKYNTPYNWGGMPVPRVTNIISSMLYEDSLMNWSNSIGFKHIRYSEFMNGVANIGSITHDMILRYIQGQEIKYINIPQASMYAFNSFRDWYDNLIAVNDVRILAQEYPLICPYYGGTLDLFITINDKPVLIDFKTSNHITYKHFLQLAAYMIVLNLYCHSDQISEDKHCMILQLSKEQVSYNTYSIPYEDMVYYMKSFLSILEAYYWRLLAQKDFENIPHTF